MVESTTVNVYRWGAAVAAVLGAGLLLFIPVCGGALILMAAYLHIRANAEAEIEAETDEFCKRLMAARGSLELSNSTKKPGPSIKELR